MDESKPDFAEQSYVDKAIQEAAFILERIDHRWPEKQVADVVRSVQVSG
jgi:hypothetical protein